MARVNKQSLREEVDALNERFERLCDDGQLSGESRALVEALLMLLKVLMAVFLDKHTPKTNNNSSKPSSQMDKDETAHDGTGSRSQGKAVHGQRSANTRTVETVEVTHASACQHCGHDLTDTPCTGHERRTRIDIIFEKVVAHVDAEIKQCPQCRQQTRAPFPAEWAGPLQYGTGIKAYVLNLLIAQMLSLKRVQQSIRTLVGQTISQATILKYVLQLHHALERWEADATHQLLAMPVLHVDETSLRVDGANHWIHVCSGGDITLKRLHRKRGRQAMEAIDIIPRYGGVIVHDCWASYLAYAQCGHGLCGAHLLRELAFIVEAEGYTWAAGMRQLLRHTCGRVARLKRKKLNRPEYAKLQQRYRAILEAGEKELPPIPPRHNGKRGCVAKSDAHNLWERLQKHEEAVLLFASDADVPFTNNRAERDLRMSKVKQKVSGCFRKAEYAHAYCRISSYLQTMASRGYNPLVAIQLAISGELYADWGE